MLSLEASRTGRQFQRYDEGCRQVVGCIPYRYKKGNQYIEDLEVLLISSQKGQSFFFPKGGWEIDESMEEAASRETQEEAGVIGFVECQLGKWRFQSKSQNTIHEGYMFPMRVTKELDSWPEKNVRQRIWMSVDEAREVCAHPWMKKALDEFVRRLVLQQQKEEENQTSCAIQFFRTEEQRIVGIGAQNGEEEVGLLPC
ncbi:nudix hydrolase 18, mitochondrial-like [Diospyros lotus]|uniref:nudix hydrolase 18, mitochondrial-like n=1 Tax=Diospyros lotus TaxID=55363 RepID=UPI002255A507|nr:nudix hydrolase 18, mitochondrial-like [Diospyros lotus]